MTIRHGHVGGKKPARHDPRSVRLEDHFTAATAPASLMLQNTTSGFYGMLGNDNYGDCVEAAAEHTIQTQAWNETGVNLNPSQTDALNAYSEQTGFSIGNSNSDQGTDMLSSMNWWKTTGYPIGSTRHKLAGYATITAATPVAVLKQAIYDFGNISIGIVPPNAFMDQFNAGQPWTVDGAQNQNNGHCVPAVGYDDTYLYVLTWGAVQKATWGFYAAYCDEAYVPLLPEWDSKGNSPEGFSAASLNAAIASFPNGAPTPGPTASTEDSMLILNVSQTVPAGVTWPGYVLLGSNGSLHHIVTPADLTALQNAGLTTVAVSYAQYASLKAGS